MRPEEAKKVAQCVADMIDTDLKHNIKHVPLELNKLVHNFLKTYVPESDKKTEIIEGGSSLSDKS